MDVKSKKEFDIIVWGATGFTGQLVSEYLFKKEKISLGLAGRDKDKLQGLKNRLISINGQNNHCEVIVAESFDLESLKRMARKGRVICNCVGPYLKHGMNIIKACISEGSHYCDLCGEIPWIKEVIDQFHHKAEEKKLKIVPSCGFDSIPSDLGVYLLQKEEIKKNKHPIVDVTFYLEKMRGGISGGSLSSMVSLIEYRREKRKKKNKVSLGPFVLYPENEPKGPLQPDSFRIEWDKVRKCWTGPFIMAAVNTRIVRRSNALLDFYYDKNFKYKEVSVFGGRIKAEKNRMTLGLLGFFLNFSWSRFLLRKYIFPSPGEGPSLETIENGYFKAKICSSSGDSSLSVEVEGRKDPGYGATAIMLGESALCLAEKFEQLSPQLGVVTPASGMGMVLIDQLNKNGVTFKVLDS